MNCKTYQNNKKMQVAASVDTFAAEHDADWSLVQKLARTRLGIYACRTTIQQTQQWSLQPKLPAMALQTETHDHETFHNKNSFINF